MRARFLVALLVLGVLGAPLPASADSITASTPNKKSPPLAVAPTTDQSAACIKEGGTYTKHADGKWYCDPKTATMVEPKPRPPHNN